MGGMFTVWVYTVVFFNGHTVERHFYTPSECRAAYFDAVDEMRGSSSVTAFACREVEVFPLRTLREIDEYTRFLKQRKDF